LPRCQLCATGRISRDAWATCLLRRRLVSRGAMSHTRRSHATLQRAQCCASWVVCSYFHLLGHVTPLEAEGTLPNPNKSGRAPKQTVKQVIDQPPEVFSLTHSLSLTLSFSTSVCLSLSLSRLSLSLSLPAKMTNDCERASCGYRLRFAGFVGERRLLGEGCTV
jgi:hypothetical protein